jgi:glycine/D-amino acid oxidase-like deaminating enzyme
MKTALLPSNDDPYWWMAARPKTFNSPALASRYDVAVIGAGLTGLRTALELARAGTSVIVLDRDKAGAGASTRSAGYLGCALKKSYKELAKEHDATYAHRVCTEMRHAMESTMAFIAEERIGCFANRCGRFVAATSQPHLRALVEDYQATRQALGWEFEVVTKDEVRREMGSPVYHGGIVVPYTGSVHPGLYHKGLLDRALGAGVTVVTDADVSGVIRRGTSDFSLRSSIGELRASHVVVATNGYTPSHLSFIARRLVPFTGFMAATEELPPELLNELIPNRRTIVDSNIIIDFFRPAPDSSRLLFGGSTGSRLLNTADIARQLKIILVRVFPQLGSVSFSNVWSGKCAGTFDWLPHLGVRDGVWYGVGFNFVGIPTGTYFGKLIADQLLGRAVEPSVFSERAFNGFPGYRGNPWFVPLVTRYFNWRDRKTARQAM